MSAHAPRERIFSENIIMDRLYNENNIKYRAVDGEMNIVLS